jgi:hypothetical protein
MWNFLQNGKVFLWYLFKQLKYFEGAFSLNQGGKHGGIWTSIK